METDITKLNKEIHNLKFQLIEKDENVKAVSAKADSLEATLKTQNLEYVNKRQHRKIFKLEREVEFLQRKNSILDDIKLEYAALLQTQKQNLKDRVRAEFEQH